MNTLDNNFELKTALNLKQQANRPTQSRLRVPCGTYGTQVLVTEIILVCYGLN